LEQLGFSKVCERWVPQQLIDAHKEIRKTICADLLARHEDDGYEFLSCIVTGDETWLRHFEPETKRQSMEGHQANSPKKKKFKAAPTAGKIMATIFWDAEWFLLVVIMPRGTNINSEDAEKASFTDAPCSTTPADGRRSAAAA
jgi:hypothetical protein